MSISSTAYNNSSSQTCCLTGSNTLADLQGLTIDHHGSNQCRFCERKLLTLTRHYAMTKNAAKSIIFPVIFVWTVDISVMDVGNILASVFNVIKLLTICVPFAILTR
ncbi:hypothetical protein GEMRC1_001097 [Eukaryota sp. GEM-RC1]